MRKFILAVLFVMLFAGMPGMTFAKGKNKTQKPVKHYALKQHALVRGPLGVLKTIAYGTLFGVEVPVDGVHIALDAVDHFGDITNLYKIPPFNAIYAGISAADTDVARLDTGIETLEMDLFGKHN